MVSECKVLETLCQSALTLWMVLHIKAICRFSDSIVCGVLLAFFEYIYLLLFSRSASTAETGD